jgi:hypothetical protein
MGERIHGRQNDTARNDTRHGTGGRCGGGVRIAGVGGGYGEHHRRPKISLVAYQLQGYRLNRAIFNAIAQRVTQAIVGEMTIDEALTRITADVDEAVAQSK